MKQLLVLVSILFFAQTNKPVGPMAMAAQEGEKHALPDGACPPNNESVSGDAQHLASAQVQVTAAAAPAPVPDRVVLERAAGKQYAYVALPFLAAFAHGLLNNWLARRAGCGVKRWCFFEAPQREWVTGGIANLIHLLVFRNFVKKSNLPPHQENDVVMSLGHQEMISVLGSLYFVLVGIMQELGETVWLPGYEGHRSFGLSLMQQNRELVFYNEMRSLTLATGFLGVFSFGIGKMLQKLCSL